MGAPGVPWYGKDLGSAIESVEVCIAKIKTNKFGKLDLVELKSALEELVTAVEQYED